MKIHFNKTFLILLLLLFCYACKKTENLDSFEQAYRNLKGSFISIPNDLTMIFEGKDSLLNKKLNTDYKLIIYRDSLSCSVCYVETLPYWQKLMDELNCYSKGKLDFIFILSPLKKDETNLRLNLEVSEFKHPIYIDMKRNFQQENPQLPKFEELNVFLLDKNNNVIMIGDPLENKKIKELLKRKCKEMI